MTLSTFLAEAKRNTYASVGETGERRLPDGSKELTYRRGVFRYRDRYFGTRIFFGEEVVWKGKKSVWGMNYAGGMTPRENQMEELYTFLKRALLRVPADRPLRGPDRMKQGAFRYKNSCRGTIQRFAGVERIYRSGKMCYELHYHGGSIERQ